ncbi:MAG: sulfotransferase domain-containing protein [Actinomycetota bacterium]
MAAIGSAAQFARRTVFRHQTLRRPLVRAYHRALSDDDVLLASYPRSGVTWLRFVLCECLTGRPAEFGSVRRDTPYVGRHRAAPRLLRDGGRLIRTHEPFIDRDRKVVLLVRDARSVAVSEYSWQQRKRLDPGSLDRFLGDFLAGRSNPWGSWDRHVTFWLRSESNRNGHLLLVRFEDLRRRTEEIVAGILQFLDEACDADVIREAVANNTVERMRIKEDRRKEEIATAAGDASLWTRWRSVSRDIRFVNTGSVEGWRQKLSPEQVELITERWRSTLERLEYLP